jgi:14-3-3 protein epsilon
MSGTRDENIFMARLAEQADRYDDMFHYMQRAVALGAELGQEERNLLSVACKNSVGTCRSAYRAVSSAYPKESGGQASDIVKGYMEKVGGQLSAKCEEVLLMISQSLIPSAQDTEAKVFFLKMKGDYHRYLAEYKAASGDSKAAQDAQEAYQAATEEAGSLPATHPIRLGLALNFSVFYYEVLGKPESAVSLAKAAFNEAKNCADADPDVEPIMQLLKENLILWTDAPGGGEAKAPEQDGTNVEDL